MEANKRTIKVTIKSVYGKELVYPVSEMAKLFAELLGRKTLVARDIQIIKQMGYTVEVVLEKETL